MVRENDYGVSGDMNVMCCMAGYSIVPRLYYIPESEFNDDLTTAGSMVTVRDLYRLDPMVEEVPFQWAQALYIITRLTSMSCGQQPPDEKK